MDKKPPLAININFDSLNEAFGFPKNFKDPSYFHIFDRMKNIADKLGIKFSIYIIGKDLLHKEVAARVREWSNEGHEIGNHSWSHLINLTSLNKQEIYNEIYYSHDIINRITGIEPKGFISNCWSTSKDVVSNLIKLNYTYDTSFF